jgi:glyoxylase-like metal-dependent hydrolase (beta-lactamase superfamily II)
MPQPIREVAPGILHWTGFRDTIDSDVSSYYALGPRVLLDPMLPADGLEWFEGGGQGPRAILLSNRHHLRDAATFVERFGCQVHASEPGMHEFDGARVEVRPFSFGDVLADEVVAHEVGVLCPDETALEIPSASALAVADGVINYDGLRFVPDELLGDDPEAIKDGLREAYARLAETVAFDHLLCAHGPPVLRDGRDALRRFAAG